MIAPSDRGLSGHGGGFRRRRYKENRLMLNFRVIPVQFSGQLLGLCLFEALCAGADCTGDRRGPMNGVLVRTTRIWDKSISWNNSGRFCVCFHRCSLARAVPCTTGGSGFKPGGCGEELATALSARTCTGLQVAPGPKNWAQVREYRGGSGARSACGMHGQSASTVQVAWCLPY